MLKPADKATQSAKNPTLFSRWLNVGHGIWSRWYVPISIFLALRIGLSALSFLAQILIPVLPRGGTSEYAPLMLDRWSERLLGVWSHWDGEWFLQIATVGYKSEDSTLAFFPLFPILIKILAFPLGGNLLLAGVVLSSASTLAVLILFYELCLHERNREFATKACFYLAVFPVAFFLVAVYSEALFLAFTLAAFLCARHLRRWWLAGLCAAAATLTRSTGILLVLPLAWEWWVYNNQSQTNDLKSRINNSNFSKFGGSVIQRLRWPVLALVLPLIALLGWIIFNWQLSGDPLGFFKAQANWVWNRHSQTPLEAVTRAAEIFYRQLITPSAPASGKLADPNLWEFPAFVFTFGIFGLACWFVWRRKLAFSYLLYFGAAMILPLTSPSNKEPLLSFPRFALVLFPMFMVLAMIGRRWLWFHYLYIYSSLLLLGLFFARFANWYWVA